MALGNCAQQQSRWDNAIPSPSSQLVGGAPIKQTTLDLASSVGNASGGICYRLNDLFDRLIFTPDAPSEVRGLGSSGSINDTLGVALKSLEDADKIISQIENYLF